jgi:hypothetical protein
MLNYELCKKLKEAGFPQEPRDVCHCYAVSGAGTVYVEGVKAEFLGRPNGFVHIPNLSELIEACESSGIDKWQIQWEHQQYHIWSDGMSGKDGYGDTVEEAVANLFLALAKQN